jgi:putative ABC transport system permease protein
MNTLLQDLHYGWRMLLKRPGFTFVAVITLALGIGANTAIFSVINAVLLRPLPYTDAARLVAVQSGNPQGGEGGAFGGVSPADFLDFKEQSQTFAELAAYRGWSLNLPHVEHPESITAARVSSNFFAVFGVEPLMGRSFTSEEEVSNGPRAVMLSHRLWQQRFGGDPSIVGRTIETVDGLATVAGVMPPSFKFPNYAEAWLPLPRDGSEMKYRASRYYGVVGRIKAEATTDAAQTELETIASRLEAAHPKDNQNWTARVVPWRDYLVRGNKPALLILMGAVGLVLLIACANVANLLLARAASRRKEMAIRLALGASRYRLMRQLLIESVMLALAGGACGLLFAWWSVEALIGAAPAFDSPFSWLSDARGDVHLDGIVLLFTLTVSVVTGIVFGLIPGWQASRPQVNEWLKESRHGADSSSHRRLHGALVITEIALALVLLVGAGLLAGSFLRMLRVDLGYDQRSLMTMTLPLPPQNRALFTRQVLDEVARTPGVESVSVMSAWTLGGLDFPFNIEGQPLASGDVNASYSAISLNHFRTLKAQLRAGRDFNDRDTPQSPAVAVINETLQRQFFADENPLGKKLIITYLNQRQTREIVGVVGDIKQDGPNLPTLPQIFVPFEQQPWFTASLVVRSVSADPLRVKDDVQRAIWAVNKNLPASKAETIEQQLSTLMARPQLYTLLLGVFAVVAVLLAAIGIYGVMSYAVAERTHEIGIRMALGAQTRDVLKLVLSNGMKLALAGIGIGLLASLGLTRLLRGLLFGVSATDPLTFAVIAILLTGVALVACYLPARRATKVDPLVALRYE